MPFPWVDYTIVCRFEREHTTGNTHSAMVQFGVFWTNGQICSSTSRLLVQESIAPAFYKQLKKRAESIKQCDPLTQDCRMGPVVSQDQLDKIMGFIQVQDCLFLLLHVSLPAYQSACLTGCLPISLLAYQSACLSGCLPNNLQCMTIKPTQTLPDYQAYHACLLVQPAICGACLHLT